MQNAVPDGSLAARVAARPLAGRQASYADDVQRLLAAGSAVMRRTESISPTVSEILREAGLSNQAFYRHFRSKDELLVAIIDDGLRQLVDYLDHLMSRETSPRRRIRRWVEGILAQAGQPEAAEATRPFVLNSLRLAAQFPEETRRSVELLQTPLRAAIADAQASGEITGADPDRDADAIYHLAMGRMQDALIRRRQPSRAEVAHVVAFVLGGLDRGT